MVNKPLNILFGSAEVTPFAKTGGLGDVASSLPPALASLGQRVVTVMPLYGGVKRAGLKQTRMKVRVKMDGRMVEASLFKGQLDKNSEIYFLSQQRLYGRKNPYGDSKGDYPDNDERFIFFSRALLKLPELLNFYPDIVHVNDWHLGLVPALMKQQERTGRASVLTIHNLAYQGVLPKKSMRFTGLPPSFFTKAGVEWYGKLGMLKAGIMYADAITTVSPTYAREILTEEFGFGLEGQLDRRRKSLHGIVNGIDTKEWDPKTDPYIAKNYTIKTVRPKEMCKAALLREFGLPQKSGKPLIGMVSRITGQKGFDLIEEAAGELMELDFSIVILGTGEPDLEKFLKGLRRRYPKRVGLTIGFDNALAHRIEAGADLFLMPSRFEPCGLNQMYSLRYGTLPIVRQTGGLNDTVKNWNPASGLGTGFTFKEPSVRSLVGAVEKALAAYGKSRQWGRLMKNAMERDNSWEKSAKKYLKLYRTLLK